MLQVTEHQVEGDGGTGVAEMGVAINGGAADVHADVRSVEGFEGLLAAREAVINVQGVFHVDDFNGLQR